MLSQKNKHIRDERISFIDDTHTYIIDGSSVGIISATTFIHQYFPVFDASSVLKKMKNKNEKYPGMSDEAIKKAWFMNGKVASSSGTSMHRHIELFYNEGNIIDASESKELSYFLDFHHNVVEKNEMVPYRTEWSIFDGDIDLAGQLDMLYQKKDGSFALYDWKRVKEIKKTNPYGERGFGILSDVSHCNFCHYSLQLHIYKKILETRYDMNITEMVLVILHPDNEGYITMEVDDMSEHVDKMFAHRKHKINNDI